MTSVWKGSMHVQSCAEKQENLNINNVLIYLKHANLRQIKKCRLLPDQRIESIHFITFFSEVDLNLISCDTQVIPEI